MCLKSKKTRKEEEEEEFTKLFLLGKKATSRGTVCIGRIRLKRKIITVNDIQSIPKLV